MDGPTLSELLYSESPPALCLLPELPPQGASPQLFPQKYNCDKVTCPTLCACLHLGPVNCNKNYCSHANNLGHSVATWWRDLWGETTWIQAPIQSLPGMGWFLFHESSFIWETRKNVSTYFGVQSQKGSTQKALKQGLSNCEIKVNLSPIWHQLSRKVFPVGNKEHIALSQQELRALNVNTTLRNGRMACRHLALETISLSQNTVEIHTHSLHCVLVQLYSLHFQAPEHSQLPN